ncbi:MAG: MarR family transcriptional regulator [Actinobacteria bacterium]|nr:MarR family transcriptional regulator [Actinomycetota bacterium]MCB9388703.1 MarR family transcriptional regulator [Acidimicrobiia bacterium]
MNEDQDKAQDVWRDILEVHGRVVARLDGQMRRAHGIPLEWFHMMAALGEATDGRLRMFELAERTMFSRTNCTRLVDRMETKGLVTREPSPGDRRGVSAVLTPEGRSILQSATPTYETGVSAQFASFVQEDELDVLSKVFERVVAIVR